MIDAIDYFRKCDHFTQVDPDKPLTDKTLDVILVSGTDAVIVAGTQNVTEASAVAVIEKLSNKTDKQIYFAPSHPSQFGKNVREYIDIGVLHGLIIYHPLNSSNLEAMEWPDLWKADMEKQKLAIVDNIIDIGYVVMNPKSAVGKLLKPVLSKEAILTNVECSPYKQFYLDGSGKLVDTKLIGKVKEKLYERFGFLLVGGGIDTYGKAFSAINNGASAVNVGTVLERGDLRGYKDTIKAAKDIRK